MYIYSVQCFMDPNLFRTAHIPTLYAVSGTKKFTELCSKAQRVLMGVIRRTAELRFKLSKSQLTVQNSTQKSRSKKVLSKDHKCKVCQM